MRDNFYNEGIEFVSSQMKSHPELEVLLQDNKIASFFPSDFLWGYSPHSYCIPPFKPESTLILGYGKGQIADLIRKIYGNDIKITGVDLVPQDYKYVEYKMVICDANVFVKSCASSIIKRRYDYVVLDLFNETNESPDFIFHNEFITSLRQIVKKLICVNTQAKDFERMRTFGDYGFKFHKFAPIFGNVVSMWGV